MKDLVTKSVINDEYETTPISDLSKEAGEMIETAGTALKLATVLAVAGLLFKDKKEKDDD